MKKLVQSEALQQLQKQLLKAKNKQEVLKIADKIRILNSKK